MMLSCVLANMFVSPILQAKLRVVPWDGYLKYYNLGDKHPGLIEKRRKVLADQLRLYLNNGRTASNGVAAAPQGPQHRANRKAAS